MKWLESCLVFAIIVFATANPSCPKREPGKLMVHLVCHTHDDVGWLKTVDQYYYGANNTIARAGVQYILDSVVEELMKDPGRKFSYVEAAFLYRWWQEQTEDMRDKVKALVSSGQLELVNGGWCMNDEADAHYTAIIDQMTLGLRFLNETFGPETRARVAWQIDPFGHSNGQASLFAQMGFDGLFFGRLDFADKEKRWKDRKMEMVWQPSKSLGEAASLFTGVLPNGYSPPKGFCFDDLCGNQPIMDDPNLEDYNVDQMVKAFLDVVEDQVKAYRSNNIIMTMGEDFNYQNARTWYKNLDKLIKYVNNNQSRVRLVYSTPSCYLDAVHSDGLAWNTKTDDFFPYASDPHAYWTGYFTSRPALKGHIRKTNAYFQALKQVSALRDLPAVDTLAKAMATAQHHDAVTGTAKQHVTDDYVLRLHRAVHEGDDADKLPVGLQLLRNSEGTEEEQISDIKFSYCPKANISSCSFTETMEAFEVVVYNSVGRPGHKFVRFPVPGDTAFKVTDLKGSPISCQLMPIPAAVMAIPYRDSIATHELIFQARDVPALGSKGFLVTRTTSREALRSQTSKKIELKCCEDNVVQQGPMALTFDGSTGLLTKISMDTSGGVKTQKVKQEFMWYPGMAGNNAKEQYRASGAYIFRPNGTQAVPLGPPHTIVIQGPIVNEVHQNWGPWASTVIRLYKGSFEVEMEWMVGPIPIDDGVGKEVIVRYTFGNMVTGGTFYTDANGREMQKRVLNHRETWQLNVTEPVAGNYYPVTSHLMLRSTNGGESVTVLTDRAQGGTSLADGQLELMVHRRLLHDDAFGVGEPLNEIEYGKGMIVRGTHVLVHSDFSSSGCDFACHNRVLAEHLLMAPVVSYLQPGHSGTIMESGLSAPLPTQIHLLTLEPTKTEGELILRLEHMFEKKESRDFSVPVTVDIATLLADRQVTGVRETVLSADQWLEDSHRLHWNVAQEEESHSSNNENHILYNYPNSENHILDIYPDFENNILQSYPSNEIRKSIKYYDTYDYSYGNMDDELYGWSPSASINPRFPQQGVGAVHEVGGKILKYEVTLLPMQIRTFIITVAKQ